MLVLYDGISRLVKERQYKSLVPSILPPSLHINEELIVGLALAHSIMERLEGKLSQVSCAIERC